MSKAAEYLMKAHKSWELRTGSGVRVSCRVCGEEWPCTTAQVIHDGLSLHERVAKLESFIRRVEFSFKGYPLGTMFQLWLTVNEKLPDKTPQYFDLGKTSKTWTTYKVFTEYIRERGELLGE